MNNMLVGNQLPELMQSIPKYLYIKLSLQNLIRSNELKPGQMLPSEKELSAQYSASRLTVRRALDDLAAEGSIYKIQGKGTYVREISAETQENARVRSCSELIRSQNKVPTRRVMVQQIEPANDVIAAQLMISPGDPVFHYERVYYADNLPAIYVDSNYNSRIIPGIEKYDLGRNSIVSILESEYGISTLIGEREIRAVQAPHKVASCLGVEDAFPLLEVLDVKNCNINGRLVPLESLSFLYHTERIRYRPTV